MFNKPEPYYIFGLLFVDLKMNPYITGVGALGAAASLPGSGFTLMSSGPLGSPVTFRTHSHGPSVVHGGYSGYPYPVESPFDSNGNLKSGWVRMSGHGSTSQPDPDPVKTETKTITMVNPKTLANLAQNNRDCAERQIQRQNAVAKQDAERKVWEQKMAEANAAIFAAAQPEKPRDLSQLTNCQHSNNQQANNSCMGIKFLVINGSAAFNDAMKLLPNHCPGATVTRVDIPCSGDLLEYPIVFCPYDVNVIRMLLAVIRRTMIRNPNFRITVVGVRWGSTDRMDVLNHVFETHTEELSHIRLVITHHPGDERPTSADLAVFLPAADFWMVSHTQTTQTTQTIQPTHTPNVFEHFSVLMPMLWGDRSSAQPISRSKVVLPSTVIFDIHTLNTQRVNGVRW